LKGFLDFVDHVSIWAGKLFSWLIVILTGALVYEVVMRYVFNAPTVWAWDLSYMLYGVHFMMGVAYTLQRKGDVRIDVFYKLFSPRRQAQVDLFLYPVFFFPALIALFMASISHAHLSWAIDEKTGMTMWRVPIYPFKTMLPVATFTILLQGVAEFIRTIHAVVRER